MYPNVPYDGYTWPITQHAGILNKEVLTGLINACIPLNGKAVDSDAINEYIISRGLVTENLRSDSNKIEAWRDYQQILSEFGLIYSTKISDKIILTPIAVAFADGLMTYEELITLQALKYQYPNGHKTDISSSLRSTLNESIVGFTSLTELLSLYHIKVRPAVVIWNVLYELYKNTGNRSITVDELQTFVIRCTSHNDIPYCVSNIISFRASGETDIQPLTRARRNMQDWCKVLSQTPLFSLTGTRQKPYLTLTNYSIENAESIWEICNQLSEDTSFWSMPSLDKTEYKYNWFAFYGNMNTENQFIPCSNDEVSPENLSNDHVTNVSDDEHSPMPTHHNGVTLRPFETINFPRNPNHRMVISEYDYNKSRVGSLLHDSMVNLIAYECTSKGANVYVDPRTVDVFIVYKDHEFIVEVKSITPSNFIARLRTAIGQVHQYNYLLESRTNTPRRLGLAFTANVPSKSWQVPFVRDYLNMDMLCLDSGQLILHSNNHLSKELYNGHTT